MRSRRLFSRIICTLLIFAQPLAGVPALADHPFARAKRFVEEATYSGVEPMTGEDSPVDCLAENIDWLEHHIDTYGSIVAKQPDIWGEARLTKYRDEYERIMFQELTNFKIKINGSIAQSDSAFLAQALALSAAAKGSTTPTIGSATGEVTASTNVVAQLHPAGDANMNLLDPKGAPTDTFTRFNTDGTGQIALEPVIGLDQLSHYLDHLHDLRRINEGDDTSDSPGYSLNLVRIPVSILPGKLTRQGFGAEITITATPVITDDLMPTTFHNLAVNDVVSLLGLPLVRVTEADIYGKLPFTEALNVLREQTKAIDDAFDDTPNQPTPRIQNAVNLIIANKTLTKSIIEALEQAIDFQCAGSATSAPAVSPVNADATRRSSQTQRATKAEVQQFKQSLDESYLAPTKLNLSQNDAAAVQARTKAKDDSHKFICDLYSGFKASKADVVASVLAGADKEKERIFRSLVEKFVTRLREGQDSEAITDIPTGRARRELNALNPTFVIPVFGFDNLVTISDKFRPAYNGRYIRWKGGEYCDKDLSKAEVRVDLLDAQRFLQAELEAAHELLNQPEYLTLTSTLAAPDSGLAQQIRSDHLKEGCGDCPSIEQYRHYFFDQLERLCQGKCEVSDQASTLNALGAEATSLCRRIEMADSKAEAKDSVQALAWMLVVESALLNERLNLDVRKVAKSKDVPDLNTSRDYLFFLPEVVNGPNAQLPELQEEFMQATDIFKKYVAARWPMHVFAIDPQEQDQNVADVSARKRELQFALAVGFVSGQIGANSLTQYSRNLQTQIETISLNQTIVGFGHGDDTFGWRFQPRVQALPVPGTFGAIKETLCGVSRDNDLRHRQLEPGQRECTAVVLMPSFVPYADFDVRSNWYALTNPKNAAITMKDAVHLSRAITAMRNSQECCSECADLYRDNEVRRLFKRVDQLDHELPLQTMRQLVPYGNTLGGFEMFNTGVTGLAPELIGWYGAPGIRVDDTGTNTFKCGCTKPCDATTGQVASIVSAPGGMSVTSGVTPMALPPCEGEGTTLFLVGNNFSINDTKVIAGGVCIPHVQLVSRSIMRVTIPSCAQTEKLCENGQQNEYVAVYVATPYGVTNHLHVPTNRPDSGTTLKDAVTKEVTSQLGALNLEQPSITVAPTDPDNQAVQIDATCTKPDCTELQFSYADGQKPGDPNQMAVHFSVNDKPKLAGQTAKFAAILSYKDKFVGSLIPVTRNNVSVGKDGDFLAVGDAKMSAAKILIGLLKDPIHLTYADVAAKPVTMKLFYYAYIGGSNVPTPLSGPIDLTVTLQLDKSCVNNTVSQSNNSTSSNPTPQSQNSMRAAPMQVKVLTPPQPALPQEKSAAPEELLPMPPPERPAEKLDRSKILSAPSELKLKPATSTGTGGCNCTMTEPFQDTQFQLAADFSELEANGSVSDQLTAPDATPYPIRMVSDSVPPPAVSGASTIANGPTVGLIVPTINMPAQPDTSKLANEQVSQITSQLNTISNAQAALQSKVDSLAVPASGVAGQSVINVNIQQPKGVCARLFDNIETPILHRAFVKSRECWRNVRDQLPCGN